MTVLFMSIGRVKDWKALQALNHEALVSCAKRAEATRYRIYRNVHNASQALFLAELPYHEAAQEMDEMMGAHMHTLLEGGDSDVWIWELTEFEGIG
jgi:hypothetical protein